MLKIIKVILLLKVLVVASNDEKCFPLYGCFSNSYPWSERSVALLPQTPEEMKVTFMLYTKDEPNVGKLLDINRPTTISEAEINRDENIYVITEGYVESGAKVSMDSLMERLLNRNNSYSGSVIVVDWREASKSSYAQAVANIRLVGSMTAHLLSHISEAHGLRNLDHVYMIGLSLGAHLSGITGKVLQKDFDLKLGRITGLDPAGPMFDGMDCAVRLCKTDALYVEAIHTDAGFCGTTDTNGHVDYYPNGGSDQPDCPKSLLPSLKSFLPLVACPLSCSHLISYKYFTESIDNACPITSISCTDYERFQNGECNKCGENGHYCLPFLSRSKQAYNHHVRRNHVDPNKSFKSYLYLNANRTICNTHYRIAVSISSSKQSMDHKAEFGRLWVKLSSDNNATETRKIYLSEKPKTYEPGSLHSYFVDSVNVGLPTEAVVGFIYQPGKLNILPKIFGRTSEMYIDYITVESLDSEGSVRLCSTESVILGPRPTEFREEYCQ